MKKIFLLLLAFIIILQVYAQTKGNIVFTTPPFINRPTANTTITIPFNVVGHALANFTITVTDAFTGTAVYGVDYSTVTQTTTAINGNNFNGTIAITLLPPGLCDLADKTILLQATGIAGTDTLYGHTTITLHNPASNQISAATRNACKLQGLSIWKQTHPLDTSNTLKFEFVNYTDFKGYDPEEPNGIAQSQFLFKIPINARYKPVGQSDSKIQWFRSFIPSFLFNRIDKTNTPLSLKPIYNKYGDSAVVSSIVGTFDFIKYSNFIFNLKVPALTLLRPKSRIQLQLSGSLYKVKVDSAKITERVGNSDSISPVQGKDTTTALNPIWATGYGAELYYDTKFDESNFPFNFRLILGGQVVKLRSGEYKQADIAALSPDGNQRSAKLLDNTHKYSAPIWNFSFMIRKNLGLKEKSAPEDHYLFFRFNYYWQFFDGSELVSQKPVITTPRKLSNNFSQFQLGVDLNFDSFFK